MKKIGFRTITNFAVCAVIIAALSLNHLAWGQAEQAEAESAEVGLPRACRKRQRHFTAHVALGHRTSPVVHALLRSRGAAHDRVAQYSERPFLEVPWV